MAMNLRSALVAGFWAAASVAGWQLTPALPMPGSAAWWEPGPVWASGTGSPACLWGEPPELRCDPPGPSG